MEFACPEGLVRSEPPFVDLLERNYVEVIDPFSALWLDSNKVGYFKGFDVFDDTVARKVIEALT